jgi:hypothetical protein
MALVKTPSSPLEISLTVGAALGAWTVTAIEADHISLRAGTNETDIRLNANRANEPSAPENQSVPAPQQAEPETKPTSVP